MFEDRNYTTFDPSKPHCTQQAREVSEDGKDGGGTMTCLWELNPDGTCPNALVHHDAWMAYRASVKRGYLFAVPSVDDWAATVAATWGVIEGPIALDGSSTI